MAKTLIALEDADSLRRIGGKALSLGKLLRAGFNVPPGYVLVAGANDFKAEALAAFDVLGAKYVAVRSSAIGEDSDKAAWAGQFETFLNVRRDSLITAIKKCQDSAQSARAQAYAKQRQTRGGAVAVIIQAMVQAEVSGVAFSINPITKDPEQIIIEAGLGLGEAIVGGQITPDTYIVTEKPLRIAEKTLSKQAKKLALGPRGQNNWVPTSGAANKQKLDDSRIKELAGIVIKLEQYWQFPVDVEWALSENSLYITQSRPITALL